MNEAEIRVMFSPVKCGSQAEFDERMHAINNRQNIENHPYLDRIRELNDRKALIESQIFALKCQLEIIKAERLQVEQKKKDVNRVFYQLKHEMIELNPKGLKNV